MSADNRNEAISTLAQIASPVAVWQAAYVDWFGVLSTDEPIDNEPNQDEDDQRARFAIRYADRAVAALERWRQAKALERTKR